MRYVFTSLFFFFFFFVWAHYLLKQHDFFINVKLTCTNDFVLQDVDMLSFQDFQRSNTPMVAIGMVYY